MLRCAPALLFVSSVFAAPTLSVDPAVSSVNQDDVFEVALLVSGEVGQLSCFAVTLDFDPAILEFVSATQGALYAGSPDPTFFQHSLDPQGDDVFSDCVLGFGTSVLAPGELARVTLKAIGVGTSPITIVEASLRDVDRALIPGVVFENASAGVTPTSTPPRAGPLRLSAAPNPSAGAVWFRGDAVPAASNLRLRIVDAQGRFVRELSASAALLEAASLRWDGRDAGGRSVAAGIYFAQLRAGETQLGTTKLVRVN